MGVLEGRIAVVTGSGRGIGREIALMFAREGARVVVNDLGGEVDGTGASKIADEVVNKIDAAGGEAVSSYDSVSTVEGGRNIFQTAIDRFGGLDILVNNAGILRDRTLFNMEEDDWDAVMAVHLKGHYCCSRPFAQYIRETKRPGCRIINFSSTSGLHGNFGQTNYGAAKAGIFGFTRCLALELEKFGTTVNAMSPGAVTRMMVDIVSEEKSDPSDPRYGPQQVAPIVTWLASPAGQGVTGQILHIWEGIVGVMQQPAVIRSFQSDRVWTLDELDQVMPVLLEAKREHDERVADAGSPERL